MSAVIYEEVAQSETKEEKEYVMGLEKGLAIIEAFGLSKGPLTLTQAAEITGHTKAAVRRSLLTLCKL
ncbi:MAG: helix-turn-helix domain-containing protein, partial [Burkholderiales bacterium]